MGKSAARTDRQSCLVVISNVKTPTMRIDCNNRPYNDCEPFPRQALEGSIGARFDEMVRRFPDKQAVHTQKYSWTYAELNARAERIALAISAHGLPTAAPILLHFNHDAPAIAGVLGVLKAGHFYCALDSAAAPEHNTTIFKSLNPRMLLCDRANLDRSADLTQSTIPIVNVDNLPWPPNGNPLRTQVSPEALAYVFFTSGTTGSPKGVMDSHRNVLHNILRYTNNLYITSDDRLTLLQTLSFSGSVSSLFCALLNGATIYPFDLRREGPAALAGWLSEQQITIYHSVPSIFRLIASEGRRFEKLRMIRLEGDQASHSDAALFQNNFTEACVLVNGLGATECGIVRQFFLGAQSPAPAHSLPIGYPIEDMEVSVLDEQGQPAPVGQIGEIAVQSRYLAVGYWQAPDLTAEAFKPSPDDPRKRMYRTGDLGRLDGNACLEYLGRKDFHDKVRGHRLSLADIEAALLGIDGIREAVASVRPDRAGENQLAVYFTAWPDRAPALAQLWSSLRERLEGYSLPIALIRLDRLPLNANGKIDRRALPEPHRQRLLVAAPISPRTQGESALVMIWKEVLELDEIGVEDSFMELGGDSLQLMRMINRVRQVLGVEVAITEFFAAPCIAALADSLERAAPRSDHGST
jgi:amino acid adenylation domain-containing protein